jgi:type III restriction enzyme
MFSFRRAADITSIAQTIGRMVRAPLARTIEENEALNTCYVFLPHYDRSAVQAVVAYLQRSGNAAVAETFETGSTSTTLALRDLPDATTAINRIPTYVVPTSTHRSAPGSWPEWRVSCRAAASMGPRSSGRQTTVPSC